LSTEFGILLLRRSLTVLAYYLEHFERIFGQAYEGALNTARQGPCLVIKELDQLIWSIEAQSGSSPWLVFHHHLKTLPESGLMESLEKDWKVPFFCHYF
jgi:hypothetical protein